ncbi:thioredoxin 1 [Aulographum hederae CBS 113979]|uniref:Thioredoxin 1 n=1 Tax=Aulographum hederae CBS 113979 TaxID=1176131 RepID=A0A6G1HC48_9PEZI|nr:thioredoxin 1 [Aulographum hederae CBS 113979]
MSTTDQIHHPTSLSALQTLFSTHTYVLLDFTATWCGPCKSISPIFAQLAKSYSVPSLLAFAKVDVDAAQDIARQYGVSAMPTFMAFKEGKLVAVNGKREIRGADVRSLTAAAEKLGGLAKKRLEEREGKA